MADMTHKHHNLIYDAIEAAASAFACSPEMAEMMEAHGEGDVLLMARKLVRAYVFSLAHSFAEKLRYTNDKFDSSLWRSQVRAIAKEVSDCFEQENN